ncbi:MAG: ESPR domain-containing protein, partial [Comamonas sp.]
MNHIYRSIWNANLCVWQAASEISRGPSKSSRSAKRARRGALPALGAGALMLAFASSSTSVFALCSPGSPTDGQTVTCDFTATDYVATANNLAF